MIGVVIVAHGGLAREYLATVEHVLGRQTGMRAISIGVNDDRASKTAEICQTVNQVDQGQGVIVVVDMYGGTPSNLSLPACAGRARRLIHGANMPMLIKLAQSRHKPLARAVELALEAGRKYIDTSEVSETDIVEMP
ncbi:MAG: PTS fructose transporter subunit IIA [Mangrovicoccus sp.]|nr:PTS fructose transporter subunit IIA [Mangrovicoccus sp.]